MDEREIYPNAPVVLVALEVRHPEAGPLSQARQHAIKQRLARDLPIRRTGKIARVEGLLGDSTAPTVRTETFPKYVSRDNTTSASFRNTAIVIETTRYKGWQKLRMLAIEAWQARAEAADIDGVERVGLRYVNEVRIPADNFTDWDHWISGGLLGPTHVAEKLDLPAIGWQGVAVFAPRPDFSLVLRYGIADGYAVDPGGDLKRPTAGTPGLFFLIDIDSFWTPSPDVPNFDPDHLAEISDSLHDPIDGLFESLITERLREEVLRHGAASE